MFLIALSAFSLQVGIIMSGDLQGATPCTYLGATVRSTWGLAGLELAVMPQILPSLDFTSYRFIVSPSIGWGTPELRIFAGIAPHFMLKEGQFDFDIAKWNIGAGASFMFARNIIGFFEFFLEFDVTNFGNTENLTEGSFINVGVTYNFDLGF
jgi:hypothetical protein